MIGPETLTRSPERRSDHVPETGRHRSRHDRPCAHPLFNFKTPEEVSADKVAATGASSVGATPSADSTAGATSAESATDPAATPTASTTNGSATTLTGAVISTRYGDVEVQVTIANGKITAVTAIELPSGGRSGQISAAAEPILASEALTAQSANIDIVSGATYTSEAYAQSLQAALDQAGISGGQATG
jgi:uncharacterized protein with FMN-binding domain